MTWAVTLSDGFSYNTINVHFKAMETDEYLLERPEFICADCKTELASDEIVQHPEYEDWMDKDVWGDSCPHCLGEIEKIN